MLKLVVVSQTKCVPCTVIKNQIMERIEEFQALDCETLFVNLDGLEDKDTYIAKHHLTSTPTIWIEEDGKELERFNGYVDLDTLLETIGGLK